MIYFFFGQDAYRSSRKTTEIKAKFLEKNPTGSGLVLIDVEKGDSGIDRRIREGLVSPGLFFSKQLLIVKNAVGNLSPEEKKAIGEGLMAAGKLGEDQDRVLVFWEDAQPKEKDKLFVLLRNVSKSQQFDRLKGKLLEKWIEGELSQQNPRLRLSPKGMEKLILFAGGDSARLAQEIGKLASYREEGAIEQSDVEALVKAEAELNIFETVEALSSGNKQKAIRLLQGYLAEGADPFYLLSMYVYQFRNLLKIAEPYYSGERNAYAISKMVGLHPFVVQKGMADLSRRDMEWLKKSYQKLIALDQKMKSGEIDGRLGLNRLIVDF